jgi:hypothetical protein
MLTNTYKKIKMVVAEILFPTAVVNWRAHPLGVVMMRG